MRRGPSEHVAGQPNPAGTPLLPLARRKRRAAALCSLLQGGMRYATDGSRVCDTLRAALVRTAPALLRTARALLRIATDGGWVCYLRMSALLTTPRRFSLAPDCYRRRPCLLPTAVGYATHGGRLCSRHCGGAPVSYTGRPSLLPAAATYATHDGRRCYRRRPHMLHTAAGVAPDVEALLRFATQGGRVCYTRRPALVPTPRRCS
jgi:hypothetical protein